MLCIHAISCTSHEGTVAIIVDKIRAGSSCGFVPDEHEHVRAVCVPDVPGVLFFVSPEPLPDMVCVFCAARIVHVTVLGAVFPVVRVVCVLQGGKKHNKDKREKKKHREENEDERNDKVVNEDKRGEQKEEAKARKKKTAKKEARNQEEKNDPKGKS